MISRTVKPMCVVAAMLVIGGLQAADKFPGVRQLMSEEDFAATGLDRLSAEQLERLDAWLIRYTAGEALYQRTTEEVREAEQTHEFSARLSGDFRGWDGDTLFRLDNGQVWRQRLAGRYHHMGESSPEVSITKNWFGYYVMTVVESGKSVGVSRVR